MRFGVHVPIGGGYDKALRRAEDLGCETMQIFCKNPRGWAAKPLDGSQAEQFRTAAGGSSIDPIVVHISYLVNLASIKEDIYLKSAESFADQISRCDALGARYLVMHPGSHGGAGCAEGVKKVGKTIGLTLEKLSPQVMILLENVAGGGFDLGGSFSELAGIIEAAGAPERIGICLDTCHAFAYGYDLSSEKGLEDMADELKRELGADKLKAVHLNDCKGELGRHLDRHHHIGEGAIGLEGFRRFINHPLFRDLPAILETPQEQEGDDVRNLATVKGLDSRRIR